MLTSLALIFLLGLVMGGIFNKLKLPSLLGMMLTGMLLGPYILDFLDDSILNISGDLREFALVIILTRAGLSLNLEDLKKVGRPAVLMCFVPAVFEIVAVVIFAPLFLGVTYLEAAIIGTVVAAVSPAVIVPRMIKCMEEGYGTKKSIPQLILAGASVDDVFVIVLFTAFTGLAAGEGISVSSFIEVPISIILGVALGILVGIILSLLFKKYHFRDSVKVLIILSVSFLLLALEDLLKGSVPVSGLLAIMTLGITLNRNYDILAKRLSVKYNKLWVAAEILLFVLVGATVDLSYAVNAGIEVVILVVVALGLRMIGVFVSLLGTTLNSKERMFCMLAYTPKATVQAAIGSIPLSMGLECGQLVLTIAVIAILITAPFGAICVDNSYKKLLS